MTRKLFLLILATVVAGLMVPVMTSAAATEKAPVKKEMKAAAQDPVARGKYLVTAVGCGDCHSPKTMTPQGPIPDMDKMLSGHPAEEKLPEIPANALGPNSWGALTTPDLTAWAGPWGVSFTANLTPDKETGLGSWTEDMFIKTIRTGKHMGVGRPILPPMPWPAFKELTDDDLKAIFAFLKTIKPIHNAVPDPVPPPKH